MSAQGNSKEISSQELEMFETTSLEERIDLGL